MVIQIFGCSFRLQRSYDTPIAVASGRLGEQLPDKSSLWMDMFSLDSVILIVVTCNCLPFSYSRSILPLFTWTILISLHLTTQQTG